MRHHILPVHRTNKSLQYCAITRDQEVATLTHTSTELKFEESVNFIGLNPHPIPTSTQFNDRKLPSLFVVTSKHFTSTDEIPLDHQWGSITFYKTLSLV